MLQQLVLRDQVNGRPADQALVMEWQESVPLTPRTLISERVRIEWEAREADHEAKARDTLVEMMRRANPYRRSQAASAPVSEATTPLTLESVTALALDGFVRNAFFLVVDGRQATDLDEVIPLRLTSDVTFVRLLPLRGG
jgi:hypothetical protein